MFFKSIDKRIKIVLFIIIFLFLLIIFKVFYIEVFNYKKLNNMASDLWSRNLPITADRGLILDRNGVVLADNITTTSLVLIPNQIEDKEYCSKVLSKLLNVSKEEMDKHVYKKTSIERVHPYGRGLSYEVADYINSLKIKGVYLLKESKRYYPYNNLLSHVLGYSGIDNQGLSGIEYQYDKYLKGKDGAIKYYSDAKGNNLEMVEEYVEAVPGNNLYLTIDINIQKSIERELSNIVDMFNPDMALALVVDPNTLEVLGMGSRPDYDVNNYKDYSMSTLSRNIPIWASYEPGSTFKNVPTIFM